MERAPTASDVPTRASSYLPSVASALWAQAESRRLARELREARVPAMVLKGPDLQERLYGTPAAYASSDVDILVPPSKADAARRALGENGWQFEPENGVMWRLSKAASYERAGFRADLHWGLHAAHLPAFLFRPLEREMWRRAAWGRGGFLEPAIESLLVFLAVHVAGHAYERKQWWENVTRCADHVEDWLEVWRIARAAHVTGTVRAALEGRPVGHTEPLLDGLSGKATWYAFIVVRGHAFPDRWRAELRERVHLWREGYGAVVQHTQRTTFDGLRLEIPDGVFPPKPVSEALVHLALTSVEGVHRPVVVEAGTGSGAISIAIKRRRPDLEICGSDISPRAVRAATRNAERLGFEAPFVVGSLLDAVPGRLSARVDALVANLPYVPPKGAAQVQDWGAPDLSIVGAGPDGLDLVRGAAQQAGRFLRPGGWLVFQVADWQYEVLARDLESMGYRCEAPKLRREGKALTARAQLVEGADE